MQNAIRNGRGSAGISAVIIMLLLATIGGFMLAVSASAVTATGSYRDGLMAQYAAELGVKHAVYQLKYEPTGTVLNNVKNLIENQEYKMPNKHSLADVLANVSYDVKYIGVNDNTRRIEAVGTVNGKVKRRMTLQVTGFSPGINPLFDKFVTYAHGALVITEDSYITGNIGAFGTITFYGGTVKGDAATTSPDLYKPYPPASVLTGKPVELTEELTVPATLPAFVSFASSDYSSGTPLSGSIYSAGTITLSDPVYYVNGDFGTGNTAYKVPNGKSVTIYVLGSIRLNGDTTITGGNITLIAGNGSIELNNGTTISAPNGRVNLCANGYLNCNQDTSVSASNILLEAVSDIQLNGSTITSSPGTTKIYTQKTFNLNKSNSEDSLIRGNSLVVATGNIELNNGTAKTTLFVSNSDIQVNGGVDVGPVYAQNNLYVYGGKITYTEGLAEKVIDTSGGTLTLNFNAWNNY